MRTGKARTGLSAGLACHKRWDAYGNLLAVWTRGGSRMWESRTYGSVRGREVTRVPTAKDTVCCTCSQPVMAQTDGKHLSAAGQSRHKPVGRHFGL